MNYFLPEHSLELWGLFMSAFVSATIAPGGSEAVLALLVANNHATPLLLVIIASIGNTLGALTTWYLGYLAATRFAGEEEITGRKQQSLVLLRKYGSWALLFSWLPLVGDGLCFAAGWLKLPVFIGCLAILVGKVVRYSVVAALFAGY